MTLANKSQLRLLKKAVQSTAKTNGSKGQTYSPNSIIAPSAAQSECSTLVDFGDDYLDEGEPRDDDSTSLLESDNTAWTRSRPSQPSSSAKTAATKSVGTNHAAMLDGDDMSWNIPRDTKRSIPTRILHALAGQ